jgi:hypothetical protein
VCLADAGVLHVAGAFKHRLLDKHADADVLRRMVQQLPIQATGGGAIPSTIAVPPNWPPLANYSPNKILNTSTTLVNRQEHLTTH